MSGVISAIVVLIALAISGGPIALCLPLGRAGVAGLVFAALSIGLVVQELVGLLALRTGHYSRPTVLVLTLVVVALGSAAFVVLARGRRARVREQGGRPDGGGEAGGSGAGALWPMLLLGGLVVVVGIALAFRQGPSYFIFATGDMGEYVNDANLLAILGHLSASFPHGFTLFLGGTNLLLGPAKTVAGLPALGAMLALGACAYARAAGLHPLAALGIAALVAVHPVAVWFSLFPVSESLYAILLIAALYFVVQARAH